MNTLEETLGSDFLLFIEKISNKYTDSHSDYELLKSICIEKYYTLLSGGFDSIRLKENFVRSSISRTCIDFYRVSSYRNKHSIPFDTVPPSTLAPSTDFEGIIEFHSIVTYIETLPDLEKEWINCFLEGMNYRDIATKYNLPMGTVRKRILQARYRWMRDLGLNYSLSKF